MFDTIKTLWNIYLKRFLELLKKVYKFSNLESMFILLE